MTYTRAHYDEDGNVDRVDYPYNLGRLRRDFPNVSFPKDINDRPDTLAEYGVFEVDPTPRPEYSAVTERLVRSAEKQEDGTWKEVWTTVSRGLDESEARLRIRQDILSQAHSVASLEDQVQALCVAVSTLIDVADIPRTVFKDLDRVRGVIEETAEARKEAEEALAELESMPVEEAAKYKARGKKLER